MARGGFNEHQLWLLGQLDAPARAAQIRSLFEQRLRALLDWGFFASASEGGATVGLGSLTLVTALCESDPPNADSVCNFIASRSGYAAFQAKVTLVEDKSNTGRVALDELERALATLRRYREEFASVGVPTGWAVDYDP